MKNLYFNVLILMLLSSCGSDNTLHNLPSSKLKSHYINDLDSSSFELGSTYLSVYSQIYLASEDRLQNLTATISIRNPNKSDTVYVLKADYFNTEGIFLRNYLESPIYLVPLETIEIVIEFSDETGGTGGNFLFDWLREEKAHPPIFEGIMISAFGQTGLAFSTQGIQIY